MKIESNDGSKKSGPQSNSRDLALIIEGGPSISASCARLVAEKGMRVGVAVRDPDKSVLQELEKAHGVRRYACDGSDPMAVESLFQTVVCDLETPTLVVHSIDGRGPDIFRNSIKEADPSLVLEAPRNLAFGAFLVSQQAARLMVENERNVNGAQGTFI